MSKKKKKGTTVYLPDDELLEEIKEKKVSKYEPNYEVIKRLLEGGE